MNKLNFENQPLCKKIFLFQCFICGAKLIYILLFLSLNLKLGHQGIAAENLVMMHFKITYIKSDVIQVFLIIILDEFIQIDETHSSH